MIAFGKWICVLPLVLAGGLVVAPTRGAERVWHAEKGFRWAELAVPAGGKTGFTLLPPSQTGIHFTNELDTRKGESNRVLANGAGLATGDFDNDGWPDLYFCSLQGSNVLYRNLGDGTFTRRHGGIGGCLSGPELSRCRLSRM